MDAVYAFVARESSARSPGRRSTTTRRPPRSGPAWRRHRQLRARAGRRAAPRALSPELASGYARFYLRVGRRGVRRRSDGRARARVPHPEADARLDRPADLHLVRRDLSRDRPAPESLPSTALSRAALERVLARAAQLQAASGEGDDAGAMSEEQLVDLGKEVGLSGDLLRQALAEERGRTLRARGIGMARQPHRCVGGDGGAHGAGDAGIRARRALDAWMQRTEATAGEAPLRRPARVGGAARLLLDDPPHAPASGVADSSSRRRTTSARSSPPWDATRRTRASSPTSRSRGASAPRPARPCACAMLLITAPLIVIGVSPCPRGGAGRRSRRCSRCSSRGGSTGSSSRGRRSRSSRRSTASSSRTRSPRRTAQALLDAFIGPPRPPR